MSYEYIERFSALGFGMYVHFGLYSVAGRGEWHKKSHAVPDAEYKKLVGKFKIKKNWARELVALAKRAGCKYITMTTRHHDGFSLYDTCGLNEYDAPHSAAGRDLVREFVDACNEADILPCFYHTLLDWDHPDYYTNFPSYIDYLAKSIELLCTNYGRIGGFEFDGMWDKPDDDWQEDRLYGIIRRHQPEAMIINNTGLSELGKVGHPEIDSVTFERGQPTAPPVGGKPLAGEMAQILCDHWGYAKCDINYKSMSEILTNLVDCRLCGCNFLLNIGPMGNGAVRPMDAAFLTEIGKFIRVNKGFIYGTRPAEISAEGAGILTDGHYYYAIVKNVRMTSSPNVAIPGKDTEVRVLTDRKMKNARWLDSGIRQAVKNNTFMTRPYMYGESYGIRVLKFELS